MAGKLYKTGESFSLDSDSSKQSLSALTWENWWVHKHPHQFTDSKLGPPTFSMEVFGLAREFSSACEADCFCSWTGSSVTRDRESQQPTVSKEASIWHFVEPQTPGKARPEDQNLTDKVSDGIEGSRLSQNLTLAQRSQMPVEHRANFGHTEFVTPLLWALNNFKEVDFFLPFFLKDLQSLIQQKRHIILDDVCLPPGLV